MAAKIKGGKEANCHSVFSGSLLRQQDECGLFFPFHTFEHFIHFGNASHHSHYVIHFAIVLWDFLHGCLGRSDFDLFKLIYDFILSPPGLCRAEEPFHYG